MDKKEIEKRSKKKLWTSYHTYIQQWQTKLSADLIEKAAETAAAKHMDEAFLSSGQEVRLC
jgi:hypothetical protein